MSQSGVWLNTLLICPCTYFGGCIALQLYFPPGNAGNILDGYNPPTKKQQSSSSEDESSEGEGGEDTPDEGVDSSGPKWQSTTPPVRPTTKDRIYYHMPFDEEKPCVYVKEMFEDHRRRMYNTNILEKIGEKLVSYIYGQSWSEQWML